MAKKEVKTDLWVARMLDEIGVSYDPQGSSIKEIDAALKTASKRKTGNAGYPEFVAVVGKFVLVIEDKAALDAHMLTTKDGILDTSVKATTDYAVNGACFYADHIAKNTNFRQIFAIGVSGDEKHHRITPLYVDDREGYKILPDLESLTSFSPANIGDYYTQSVLEEKTSVEKTTEEILKDAAELHEYLRTYGALKDQDKPLVVSGILLALDDKFFDVNQLMGDSETTDGQLIYDAIQRRLRASNVGPDVKRDKLMNQFAVIKDSAKMNEINEALGKTPLKFYTEFLEKRVRNAIRYNASSEDFIGRFYGEFMSYSGGDGQSLGIILTPRHICELFCELLDIRPNDVVLDPTCGTGGFLVAAMHYMLNKAGNNTATRNHIKKRQLHGIEIQPNMFTIAATNMILRGDGNSNIQCEDFLKQNPAELQLKGATIGMMNPPYSQGTTSDPMQYELSFVEHLLDSLAEGARCAVIIPQPSMTGKTKHEKAFKESILKHHTLEGVITLNTNTFYQVGTNPVIAIFTAHEPHPHDHICKFIDFRDDGYEVRPHIGLLETASAKDKRQHLLDVWNGKVEASSKFCVQTEVEASDEWLHSFYYFNDEIPTDADFEKSIGDYLSFEFSMVMKDREYLFEKGKNEVQKLEFMEIPLLTEKKWCEYAMNDLFIIGHGFYNKKPPMYEDGEIPFIGASDSHNGITGFTHLTDIERNSKTGAPPNEPLERKIFHKGAICVTNNGSVGYAYYQPETFTCTHDVNPLYLKHKGINEALALFLCVCIHMQAVCFEYARKWRPKRMIHSK